MVIGTISADDLQLTGADDPAGLAVEEDDAVGDEVDIDKAPDLEQRVAEHDAGEQEFTHADLDRGFHTGRHRTVDLALELSAVIDGDELRTDTEDEILIRQDRFFLHRVIFVIHTGNVILEDFVLVILFDVILLLGQFLQLIGFSLILRVQIGEPLAEVRV